MRERRSGVSGGSGVSGISGISGSSRRAGGANTPHTALWLLALLLVGALGYLAGSRKTPPEMLVVACPEVERCEVQERAEPAADQTAQSQQRRARPQAASPESHRQELPALDSVSEPREELLAYLQGRSEELSSCASSLQRLRLTLRLEVQAGGEIGRAQILNQNPKTAPATAQCVVERLQGWTLPAQWVPEERVLIVSLVI